MTAREGPGEDHPQLIGRKAVQGVMWTYLSFAGGKLLLFASTVILARLLLPYEFGQVAFALLVIGYMETVGDFGVSSALIYERERPEEGANIAFITSIATGLLWFGAAYAAAPLVADFFNDPEVVPILRMLSVVFIIKSLGNTHDALLRRDLAFKKRIVPDFALALLKGVSSVAFALAGWGVWSLVWGQIIGTVAATIGYWVVMPWRPSLRASWTTAKRMLRYGSHIVSVNMVSAAVHHADFLVVGRMLGSAALGLYTIAYRTPEFFITMVVWVIGKVTFPVYSKLRDDAAALRAAFLATLRYLSLVTLPAGFGLAVIGDLLVSLFYGERWAAAALALQILAIAGALRSLGSHAGDVYKATGRPAILTKLGLLRAAVIIPATLWGARYGIVGVAVAQLVVTAASTLLNLYVAGRILSLPWTTLLHEFRTAAIACAVMVAALELALPLLRDLPDAAALAGAVCVGAGVYVGMLLLIGRNIIKEARAALQEATRKPRVSSNS